MELSREATALSKPRARQCERSERCRRPGYTDHIYGSHNVAALTGRVKKYIQNQQQHHQRMSFQDEFRELCRRHGLELDEQYAWD